MQRFAVITLSVLLGILMLVSLFFLLWVPWAATFMAFDYPEFSHLRVPYQTAAMLAIVSGQVALVFIWKLLRLVSKGLIFQQATIRWVNGIIICFAVASLLAALVFANHMIGNTATSGSPTTAIGTGIISLLGISATLLMVVMRGLLAVAINNRGELDSVI